MTKTVHSVKLQAYASVDLDRLSYSNGDIVYDNTNRTLRVMDGVSQGGEKVATQTWTNSLVSSFVTSSTLTTTLNSYATQDGLNAVRALTVTVNGTAITLGGSGSITAASLAGNTLAPTVVTSSLTSVGNLTNLNVVGALRVGGINVKSFSIAMAAALA
jgi:hypothetical protein